MKGITLAACLGFLSALLLVDAHTYLSSLDIDCVSLPEGDCIRPKPIDIRNNSISAIMAPNMTCGVPPDAVQPSNRNCPIAAGDTFSVQFHAVDNSSNDIYLNSTHQGPCIFYLAPLSSQGAGDVWIKIQEDGYHYNAQNPNASYWCTDTMLANKGRVAVTIPSSIAPDVYFLRTEIIALHKASTIGGAQFYIGCAQLNITGSGSAKPSGVAIPGVYNATDPGILFNLYTPFPTSYIIPGPTVFSDGTNSSSSCPSS